MSNVVRSDESDGYELLPCPFCGCESIDLWPMKNYKSPVCNGCGATICETYTTGEDTEAQVKAWNTRVKK